MEQPVTHLDRITIVPGPTGAVTTGTACGIKWPPDEATTVTDDVKQVTCKRCRRHA